MQQEGNNSDSDSTFANESPAKRSSVPGSAKRRKPKAAAGDKSRSHHSSYASPNMQRTTTQGAGCSVNEMKQRLEDGKRLSGQKSEKKNPGGSQRYTFTDALIRQWCKNTGLQIPASEAQENRPSNETEQRYAAQERKIEILQRKLQESETTLASLCGSKDAEARVKEECLRELNNVWERVDEITKYSQDISETISEFQKLYGDLSQKYDSVVKVQQSDVKMLQNQLTEYKSKDEERRKLLTEMKSEIATYEKRIQDMVARKDYEELKKKCEETENKLVLQKNSLVTAHAEEKLKLMEEQEKLMYANERLKSELKDAENEKRNALELITEKDKRVSNLEEQLLQDKKQIESVLCQNVELTSKYEASTQREDELCKELQLKTEELQKMRRNLDERQRIESDLAKDLKTLDANYSNVDNKFKIAQERNAHLQAELRELKCTKEREIVEIRNRIKCLEEERDSALLRKDTEIKEATALVRDFESKVLQMKQTIDSQSVAYTKLNEILSLVQEENHKLREEINRRSGQSPAPLSGTTQRSYRKSTMEQEENESGANDKRAENKKSQENRDIFRFNAEDGDSKTRKASAAINSPTRGSKRIRFELDKSPVKSSQREPHCASQVLGSQTSAGFEPENDEQKKNSYDATGEKKFFKTRASGIRQYGSSRKSKK